jgi:hypothetical protein
VEASEAAAVESPAEGQVSEPEAPGAETTQPEGGDETPDVHQELAALRQSIESRLPEEEAEPEIDADLYRQLAGVGQEPEIGQDFDPNAGYEDDPNAQFAPEQYQDEEAQLRSVLREEAQAIIGPYFERQELNNFAEKHPDIREPEVLNGVLENLAPLSEQFGQAAYTNPKLVRMAYLAHKAEAAAAAETPAEAVGRGAVLETGAGAGTPESEPDPEKAYKERIFGQGAQNTSVF